MATLRYHQVRPRKPAPKRGSFRVHVACALLCAAAVLWYILAATSTVGISLLLSEVEKEVNIQRLEMERLEQQLSQGGIASKLQVRAQDLGLVSQTPSAYIRVPVSDAAVAAVRP